jgi:hypothetical protein
MKTFLIVALSSFALTQTPGTPQNPVGLEVLSLKVKESVYNPDVDTTDSSEPPSSVTRPNPNAGRPTNRNETETERLERQTNLRVQNMHALEATAKREGTNRPSRIRIYESEAEIKNGSAKPITGFVWAYQASPALQYTQDQEFLCNTKIAAGETKRVKVLSLYPNQKVVNVAASGAASVPAKPMVKDVIVNQIRFADGTMWQRPNWNPIVLSTLGARTVGKGKCEAL